MIFIGSELSDPNAHFVTNIISCVGKGNDLIIDLRITELKEEIYKQISDHLMYCSERFVIYNAYEDEDFFIGFKHAFPALRLITVFSDDEWRHANYDRYLALYSDLFTIAVKENVELYKEYGAEPFYMPWACNPSMFYPLSGQCKNIDVSFIGSSYGPRIEYIRFLIANGINVRVYGRGWGRFKDIAPYWGGVLSHHKMLEIVARSKVNLNFLWTSAEKERCTIKGRTLELSACNAFQLSNYTKEFVNYGYVDAENIAIFRDKNELLEKINYYLDHEGECKSISNKAYEHVLRNHTWEKRFQGVFDHLEKDFRARQVTYKYRILVLMRQGVQHQIKLDDDRLDIQFCDLRQDWSYQTRNIDGVVSLQHDSSINNESLYMMAFGLSVDKSDIIAANFYVGLGNNRYWVRFRDRLLEKKQKHLKKIPIECMMFAGLYAAKSGCKVPAETYGYKFSYIEYPSFSLHLPYFQSRLLRMYFGHHRNPKQKLKEHIWGRRIGKALSLVVDKLWQKII